LVRGNQIMVGVGVSVMERVGVSVGMGFRPEQAARTSPKSTKNRGKIHFARMVSFIGLKTGRIKYQGVVQLCQSMNSACYIIHSTASSLNLPIRNAYVIRMTSRKTIAVTTESVEIFRR
jgi:hypothetical protein